jgi:hypothetical protein
LIASLRVAGTNDYPDKTEELNAYNLKSGTVIGVGYNHAFGAFVTSFFQTVWSHCGIIWKEPETGQIYVLEAANYDSQYKGVFKIPLSTWIRFNRNSHIGLARINKEVDSNKLIEAFNERASYMELDSFSYKWYRLLYKQSYFEDNERVKHTCYEIVTTVLQDVGVVAKKYACSSYNPSNIMEGEYDFDNDYNFEPPVNLDVSKFNKLREVDDTSPKGSGCC